MVATRVCVLLWLACATSALTLKGIEPGIMESALDTSVVKSTPTINSTFEIQGSVLDSSKRSGNRSDHSLAPRRSQTNERIEAVARLKVLEHRSEVTGVRRNASSYSKHEVASKVSIVIKTFERPSCLVHYLQSIRVFYPDIPILIADDSQQVANTSQSMLGIPNVRYFPLPFDTGVSAGRNFLLDHVWTPFFVISDDDNMFTSDTVLENILADIEFSGADIVGACNREPTNSCVGDWDMFYKDRVADKTSETPKFATLQIKEVKHDFMQIVEQRDGLIDKTTTPFCKEADMVANFFIARTAFVDGIRWDPFFKVGEHEDFFYRAKLAHAYIRFCTNTAVTHEHQTCLQRSQDEKNYKKFRGRAKSLLDEFFRKHAPIRRLEMPWAVVEWQCPCDSESYASENPTVCNNPTNQRDCAASWQTGTAVEVPNLAPPRQELEIQDGVASPLAPIPEDGDKKSNLAMDVVEPKPDRSPSAPTK
eukprot:c17064_g1_i1.p1 GENE.c17064_g1_i1~~c17064_g1_i1.p1  ORF type:complete len:479 (+),score=84.27 c17064_g1_i1:1339-2775(+)